MKAKWLIVFSIIIGLVITTNVYSAEEYAPGEILVKFKTTQNNEDTLLQSLRSKINAVKVKKFDINNVYQLKLQPGTSVESAITSAYTDPNVEYAEPNYKVNINVLPNDPSYSSLWGMPKIQAPGAWDIITNVPDNIVIAVIDTGVDYNHPDLAGNIWTGPNGEHGYDFYNNDSDPMDDHNHGTHVAGTIAAVGNNGIGVAGVAWRAKIMAVKFLGASGSGTTAGAISAIQYAVANGAKILSNSWGGGGYSQALKDAILASHNAGTLFVAAAGNSAVNNDTSPHYPSSYDVENIIAVAATDSIDNLASFSNYGPTSVDLAAPGVSILSTVKNGGYGTYNGTSMATPHISGICALAWTQNPQSTNLQIKARVVNSVDVIAGLQGKILSNGRANLYKALTMGQDNTPPAAVTDLSVTGIPTYKSATLSWTAVGDDNLVGTANKYDIRYSTTLIDSNNFGSANTVNGTPTPNQSGQVETFIVQGLSPNTTYYLAIKVLDEWGNASDISNVISAKTGTATILFQDRMENGLNGWTISGTDGAGGASLWHLSQQRFNSTTTSWYYGNEKKMSYDTGARNYGSITSPTIDLTTATSADLMFNFWRKVESYPSPYDVLKAEVSYDNGTTWTTLWTKSSTTPSEMAWLSSGYISLQPGGQVRIRFSFDTIDNLYNNYEGIYIDDIEIVAAEPADTTPPAAVTDLAFQKTSSTYITLQWTAPGDDGNIGTALSYDIRYNTNNITSGNWKNATPIIGEPKPQKAGSIESFTLTGLSPNTKYYLAIKSLDNASNESGLSNVINTTTLTPPNAVVNPTQMPLVSLQPDQITTKTLTISNTGGSPLEFSLTDIKVNGLNATTVYGVAPMDIGAPEQSSAINAEYIEGELLVKTIQPLSLGQLNAEIIGEFKQIGVYHLRLNGGLSVQSAIEQLKSDPNVIYAEPNYVAEAFLVPNDPQFTQLYGMNNTGQTGGTADADIDAPEAWNYFTGTAAIVVAVIDTGVDYNHPDLVGTVMATGGYDFYNNDPDPMDDHGHGTHVSGTIGGIGNNGVGVAGVNWTTKILPIKFLSAGGGGSYAGAINSVLYSVEKGAKVSSNSWGGSGYSQALYDAINYAGTQIGQLFVAAAGNSAANSDQYPLYPAAYNLPNIISVAATDHNDALAYFSNWGPVSVDLGAPGVGILSTLPNNNYAAWSGTSMATPHVSGAAALVWSQNTGMTYDQVKSRLLSTVDPKSSLSGKCVSNGRLNIYNAIQKENDPTPPANVADLAAIDSTFKSITLAWTAVGDDGNTGTATQYDLRYSTSPITDFNTATQVAGEPQPAPAGSKESVIVTGLDFNKTYYFAIKVADNVGNWSGLSNVPSGSTKVPTIVFQDDMEQGASGWTAQSPWAQAYSDSMCWTDSPGGYYGNNQSTTLTSPAIDLTKLASASLEFRHKYELEKDFDFAYIEGSHDNGVTWIQIKSFTGKKSTWAKETIDLTSSCMGKTLKLRFKLVTDSSVTYDGWYIDDIVVLGSATASGWLKPNITSGIVQPGASTTITLTYDATGLAFGSYSTQLNISTDDPLNYLITVLASLSVEPVPPSGPPNITITQPSDGALFKTSQINVSGTIDYQYSSVTVNGTPAVVSNNTWGATITLLEGQNTITVIATNSAGSTTKSIKVTLDTTPPAVTIKQPADGSKTKEASITVSGSVSDSVGVAGVTVNSQPATINGSNFTATNITLAEGSNTITAQATDTAGNTKIVSITVIKDTTPPVITITSPVDGSTTLISPATVSGTINETATVTVNGSAATVTNLTYSGTATLTVGTNTITVSASDTLGNTSSKSITVTYILGPRIDVSPSSIPQVTLGVSQTTTQTMTIKNIGDQDLVYSIGAQETTTSSTSLRAEGEAISYADSELPPKPEAPEHHPTRLLVKFKEGLASAEAENIHALVGAETIRTYDEIGVQTVEILSNMDLKEAIAAYMQSGIVEYAEYDYKVEALVTPNDPMYGSLWGMPKIQAPQAWDYTKGGDIVVGVIDTGVDYNHQDLTSNMWHNPGEVPGNGADDDGNGYVDDYYGINAITNSGNPMDDHGHGTHVSGTIAGIGNNGVGVVGVTWSGTKIMALKFLSSGGSGYISDALECLNYANNKGAKITSNSWGGGGYSQAFKDAITAAEQKGYLFAAAAGNSNSNNDTSPMYPASYNNGNIISVAATNSADNKASWSSYGANTVDLGAPGVGILSCLPGNSYASWSGTSMATPHVSGACALVWGQTPGLTGSQVKIRIMNAVDPVGSMAGITVTGGRLNVFKAIEVEIDTTPPAAITNLSIAGVAFDSVTLAWTAVGDDGNTGTASVYDLRYSTSQITASNFDSATKATGLPTPKQAGSSESFRISGLLETTKYYFAIKAIDNKGNTGSISNVPIAMTTKGTTIFSDDMESGTAKWSAESPWALVTNTYKSASHSWHDSPGGNYGDNVTTRLTSIPIDLSKYNSARLTFWHKYSLEVDYDYGYLLISTDNGNTWTLLNTYNDGGVMNSWSQESIDITNYCGSGKSNVKIRFMLVTDYSVTYDGWYIDDVKIYGDNKLPSWLSLDSVTGYLTPNQSKTITLTYNSSGLSGGTYSADLKIYSNDAVNPTVTKPVSLIVDATPPAAPTGLVGTGQDSTVTLTWTANTEADLSGYNIYVKSAGSGTSTNIAGTSTPTSSTSYGGGYGLTSAIDNNPISEWASYKEITPWIKLSFATPVAINKVALISRPNHIDRIYNGVLEFSDGSTITTGELPYDGSRKEFPFTSKTISWVKLQVTNGAGYNVGLSEFEVYNTPSSYTKRNSTIITTNSYQDTGLGNGTTYNYVVTAVDKYNNESGYSTSVNSKPKDSTPPAAPTGLIVSDPGTGDSVLSWIANTEPDIAGYNIYRGGVKINTSLINAVKYTDTGLTKGTSYTYSIKAQDTSDNESISSSSVSVVPGAPNTPTGLTATGSDTKVTLSWTANTEADLSGYNIYVKSAGSGTSTNIAGTSTPTSSSSYGGGYGLTSAIDNNPITEWASYKEITPWIKLSFATPVAINKVALISRPNHIDRIYDGVLEFSDGSTITTGELPYNGSRKEFPFTSRTISWVKLQVTNGSGYNVGLSEFEVYSTPSSYTKRNSSIITTNSYQDTGLSNGTTYNYVVTAVDKYNNESGYSTSVSNKPKDSTPPTAPTGLAVSDPGTGDSVLSWTANSELDIAGYNIYRGGVKINTSLVSAVTYTDTGLTKGTSYTYTITAQDTSDNESIASGSVSVVPGAPNTPTGLVGTGSDTKVTLSWTANTEADLSGYNIYVKGAGSGTSTNIAGTSTPTSSTSYGGGYGLTSAIDNNPITEWASYKEITPWIKLSFATPVAINKVALISRPNHIDRIYNAVLEFSDGYTITTGELPYDSSRKEFPFTSRTISWVKLQVTNGAGYNVGLSEFEVYSTPSSYTKRNSSIITTNSYQDTGLSNGTTYNYVVTAVDKYNNESGYSTSVSSKPKDSTPPTAPTGLSVSDPGTGDSVLSWTANPELDIAGYNIYRGGVKINTSLVNAVKYTDTGLTKGTSYTYSITAQDTSDNESIASGSVSVVPGAPNTPTGLVGTGSDTKVTLSWTANTEADLSGYNVYVKSAGSGTSTNIAGTSTPTSSTSYGGGYGLTSAIDNNPVTEWASYKEITPWIKLSFATPVAINKVALISRPNHIDRIYDGVLEFSDGYTITTGELPYDGSRKEFPFTSRTISWVKLQVTNGTGYNVGLSEFEVYSTPSSYTKRNSSIISTNSYQDTGLSNGTTYNYVVTAVDKYNNESGYSNEVSASPSNSTTTTVNDPDNDSIYDVFDKFPNDPYESEDTDNDGLGNIADLDDDNDGIPDADDDFPYDPTKSKAKHIFTISASMPTSWDKDNAWKSFLSNLDVLDEVNPYWYEMQTDGTLTSYEGAKDINLIKLAHDNNAVVIPYIANKFDPARVSSIVNSTDLTIFHIQNIVNEAVNNNYDGINIDYESCYSTDRNVFTRFIKNLAVALHNKGKMLSISIEAKTYDDGTIPQDWQALAQVVDKFRIMAYDYSYKTSPAGPIAPLDWLDQVNKFALTVVDPKKLIMGIPFYGYDWIENNGTSKTWLEAKDLITTYNIIPNWNSLAQEPYFGYSENNNLHTVYYENSESISHKLDLFYSSNVKGISIWRIGSEDPNNWGILRNILGIAPTNLVVSCLGDSITHGYPYLLEPEKAYPAQLEVLLDSAYGNNNCKINNYGISGIRADQLLMAMQNIDWANGDPDMVLLKIGGNDLAQETLPDGSNLTQVINQTVSEVQAIVNLIKNHTNSDGSHPKVIVSTFIPVQDYLSSLALKLYNDNLKNNLTSVDLLITTNWDDIYDPSTKQAYTTLMYDELHPNVKGYSVMAENWFEAIKSLLKK